MNNIKDEEVKTAILEAAKRVFQKWGLNKTTMEDIAHAAGKGKSTLYYYYKSKDEIFEYLAINEISNIIQKAKVIVANEKTAKDKLKKYIVETLNQMKNTISIYPLVKGEIKGNKVFIEKLRNQIDVMEESIIQEILMEGIAGGEFNFLNKDKVNKAANVIVGIIRGLDLYLLLDNDDSEKIDMATKIIAEGL